MKSLPSKQSGNPGVSAVTLVVRVAEVARSREGPSPAWDGEEVARVGEGEEGGLVGSAEPGDPNLAGGPVLPMKLRVCRSGICLLSLCNSFYSLCCSLWPPKVVP